jgi:cell division septal protein FtsQ
VVERQPSGIWCFEKGDSPSCFWFDSEGTIFKKAFQIQGNLLVAADDYSQNILPLGSKILPADFLANFLGIIQVLKNAGLNIKEIRLNDLSLEEIEADLNSGPKLYFSLRFSPLNDLSVINYLKQNQNFNKLQYIDFRSENRAFYK